MSSHDSKDPGTIIRVDESSPEELTAFERWELPALNDEVEQTQETHALQADPDAVVESVEEVDAVELLTAEELEEIRRCAHEEGYETGKKEGYQAGYQAGYDEGYKKGYGTGEEDVKAASIRLSQICRALLEPIPSQDDQLEKVLLELIESICRQVVRRELLADSQSITLIVKEALDCLNPAVQRIRIHLNPDDLRVVQEQLRSQEAWDEAWQLLPHQSISPGGCIIDADNSLIDARAEKRLAAVIRQVYEKPAESLDLVVDSGSGLDQLMSEVPSFSQFDADAENKDEDSQIDGASDRGIDEEPGAEGDA